MIRDGGLFTLASFLLMKSTKPKPRWCSSSIFFGIRTNFSSPNTRNSSRNSLTLAWNGIFFTRILLVCCSFSTCRFRFVEFVDWLSMENQQCECFPLFLEEIELTSTSSCVLIVSIRVYDLADRCVAIVSELRRVISTMRTQQTHNPWTTIDLDVWDPSFSPRRHDKVRWTRNTNREEWAIRNAVDNDDTHFLQILIRSSEVEIFHEKSKCLFVDHGLFCSGLLFHGRFNLKKRRAVVVSVRDLYLS